MSTVSAPHLQLSRVFSPGIATLCLAIFAVACDGPPPVMDAGMDAGPGTVCRSDRECSSADQVCDRTSGYCVECVTGTDCLEGQACRNSRCEDVTPCTSSRMCPGLVCDLDRSFCVECVTEVDCTGEERCRDGDCVPPPRPCESDRQCSDIGLVCDAAARHCVECLREADCPTDRFCADDRRCLPDTCSAGETRCASSTQIEACLGDGSGFGAAVACGPAHECADGACRVLEKDAGTDAGSEMDAGADASDGDAGTAPDAGPVTRYALAFDGDGDEVEFPMSFGDVGQRFTYEMWVRPTSSDAGSDEGEGGMLFVHRAHCRDVVLEWSGSVDTRIPQRFRFWVYGGSGSCGWVVAQSGSTSTVGDWHHVAGVFEDGAMRLYVDGVLAASATQPTAPSWTANLLGHWAGRDGADSRPTRGGFIGEIDELRVSSTARYAGSSITPPVHLTTDESTLGLWLFDEGSGIVISDASSTGLDGTIRNATWVLSSR